MTEGTPAPATWEPGDPLYSHPHYRVSGDGNYIREMFQVMYDEEYAVRVFLNAGPQWQVRCDHCLVGWGPDEGSRCWVCGKHAANYDEAYARAERVKTEEQTAVFVGGPRDGDCIEVRPGTPELFVPDPDSFAATWLLAKDSPPEPFRSARYVRSYFNYSSRYWVYTYKETA